MKDRRQPSLTKLLIANLVQRTSVAMLALVILFSGILSVVDGRITESRYRLSSSAKDIVGTSAYKLTQNLTKDSQTGDFIFRQNLLGPQSSENKIQNKEGHYSITIKADPKEGISYYDPDSTQSFTIKPNFEVMQPRAVDNRVIIPARDSETQQVLTFKGNGLKEDLVLNVPQGDSREFSYTLDLPASLEARLEKSGEIGIYTGTEQGLFGTQISFGSDKDRKLVEKAQAKAKKDKLVFLLPAPEIVQSGGDDLLPETRAYFELKGNILTVKAAGLARLKYPVSIDPSAIVTSATDFDTGNDEGDVNFDSGSNQIKRAALTGGDVTSVSVGATLGTQRSEHALVAYNSRLYALGGCTAYSGTCSTATTNVESTIINDNGSLAGWSNTASNNLPVAWYRFNATVYNGYIYLSGGVTSGGSPTINDAVYYGKIKSDGNILSWNSTSALGTPRHNNGLAATNGYLFAISGCSTFGCTSPLSSTESAPIKADGSLGQWSSAGTISVCNLLTGCNVSSLVITDATAYNGLIYYSSASLNTITGVLRPDLNSGTLNQVSFLLQTSAKAQLAFVRNGYLYDYANQYTPINSDGKLNTSFRQAQTASCSGVRIAYKSTGYCVGDDLGASPINATSYFSLSSPGRFGTATTTASGDASSLPSGRQRINACAVAYDGYVYVAGGNQSTTSNVVDNVLSAQLSAEGGIKDSSWQVSGVSYAGGTFTTNSNSTTVRTALACEVSNGNLYVIGGGDGAADLTDIQFAPLSAGVVGTFTVAKGKLPAGRSFLASAVYNNSDGNTYIYALGGCASVVNGSIPSCTNAGATAASNIYYGKIDASTGTVCGWTGSAWDCSTASTNLKTTTTGVWSALHSFGTAVYNGRLYTVGGQTDIANPDRISSVRYITISTSGGDLTGSWTATNSMGSTRAYHTTNIWNGHLYVAGGASTAGNLSSTEYGVINSSGAVTWSSGPDLGANVFRSVGVAHGGNALVITGSRGGTITRVYTKLNINNGGAGVSSAITDKTDLPNGRYGHSAAAYNGYLYVAGGALCSDTTSPCTGSLTATNTILRSQIDGAGELGAWATESNSMTANRFVFGLVAYNNTLYALGGCTNNSCSALASTTTEQATIASNGTLGTWGASANSFSTARYGLGATVYNGYIYIGGGCSTANITCSTSHNDVQYAAIANDGSLGAWGATTSFSTARYYNFLTTYNGYLYAGGGRSTAGSDYGLPDMQYAAINSNGTVGSFTTEQQRFAQRGDKTFVVRYAYGENGYMIAVGGVFKVDLIVSTIQSAPIGNSGALNGRWNTSSNVHGRWFGDGIANWKGTTFMIGGLSGFLTYLDVYSFSTYTLPRQGTYSKLLDTDVDTSPVKLLFNGTNVGNASRPGTEGMGGLNIRYKSITNSGTSGYSTLINPGVGSILGTLFNYTAYDDSGVDRGVARGYLLTFNFDASQTATFPDSGGNFSTITDYTLWYHPGSSKRLRGGATFTGESLRGLDAPPN